MSDAPISKFGRVALEKKYIEMAQLQECLRIQLNYERKGKDVKLGTILLAKKYLTPAQVQDILNSQKDTPLGNSLLQFPARAVIYREGSQENHDLFLLRRGRVELWKNDILLETREGMGAFFGISGFLLKGARSATVIARTDCEVLQIVESNAISFFQNHPDMLMRLTTSLARSLYQLRNALTSQLIGTPSKPAVETAAPKPPKPVSAPAVKSLRPENPPLPAAARASAATEISKPKAAPVPPEPVAVKPAPALAEQTPLPLADAIPLEDIKTVPAGDKETSSKILEKAPEPVPVEFVPAHSAPVNSGELNLPPVPASAEDQHELTDEEKSRLAEAGEKYFQEVVAVKPQPFSAEIRQAVKKRIDLFLQIEKLEEERQALEKSYPAASERLKMELARQRREFVKIPPAEALRTSKEKLEERLKSSPAAAPAPAEAPAPKKTESVKIAPEKPAAEDDKPLDPDSKEAKLARAKQALGDLADFIDLSDFADDEALGNAEPEAAEEEPPAPAPSANTPALEPDLRAAYEIAVRQKEILLKRYDDTPETLSLCAACCENEPLYVFMRNTGLAPDAIFGWGILVMALKEYAEVQNAKLKTVRKQQSEMDDDKSGSSGRFLGIGKKADAGKMAQMAALADEEKLLRQITTNITRDISSSEAEMVNVFWEVYRQLGQKYVSGVGEKDAVLVRAFLRWGMLGLSERWLAREQLHTIILDCYPPAMAPQTKQAASNLFYADEIILFTARGMIPPSPNEDLELNHRNSTEWKVDRAWRRLVNLLSYEVVLREMMRSELAQAEVMRGHVDEIEKIIEKKKNSANPDKKKIINAMRQKAQNGKVKAARAEKNAERIEQVMLPRNTEEIESCRALLREIGINVTPEALAAHEIMCLRRNSRLVAKLKEPFLPFALRDRFKPELGCAFTRAEALAMLTDSELRDPSIFQEPVIPNAKKQHQIFIRRTPITILAPAGGVLGFVMGPRAGIDSGRYIIPSYVERSSMREEILWNALSDFRYDTSKAAAGMDVMTSDTLVAAYATVRWNLRKRDREQRQKSGIYTEENERTNFRRHYALYMKSALDSGKLLFYKLPELYELIINKFIDLPKDCEILKR